MNNRYYTINFVLFWGALILGMACRVYLKLMLTDVTTGFYSAKSPVIYLFSGTMGAVIVLLILLNRLKLVRNDYPVVREGKGIGVLSLLSGAALALFVLENTGWFPLTTHSGTELRGKAVLICGALGMAAAISLIVGGVAALTTGREETHEIILLIPAVWQAIFVVCKYNSYITITTNADNLLLVMFMVFSTLFLIGNARTINGFARKNGRNYLLPAGLITALMGFLLTIPNYVQMLVQRTGNTVLAMGDMESIWITIFSLYALASVVRFRRSIAYV